MCFVNQCVLDAKRSLSTHIYTPPPLFFLLLWFIMVILSNENNFGMLIWCMLDAGLVPARAWHRTALMTKKKKINICLANKEHVGSCILERGQGEDRSRDSFLRRALSSQEGHALLESRLRARGSQSRESCFKRIAPKTVRWRTDEMVSGCCSLESGSGEHLGSPSVLPACRAPALCRTWEQPTSAPKRALPVPVLPCGTSSTPLCQLTEVLK